MSRPYDLWTVQHLVRYAKNGPKQSGGPWNDWIPARPLPYKSLWNRLKLAWLVLRYKADAFTWAASGEEQTKEKKNEHCS